MYINKMYKLEKMVISNNKEKLSNIDNPEELDYINGAKAIPYREMLKHIEYYYNHPAMDEGEALWWIDKLSKKYKIPGHIFIKRFKNVDRLSTSLFYKKRIKKLVK